MIRPGRLLQRIGTKTDCVLVFGLAALLIWPLFRLEYYYDWGSIESTFISDGRFLAEHWPHPRWQPLWYCGTRFDYIYPPALRYGTAALAKVLAIPTARAYHLYVAILYCLGIAGVYLLVRTGSGSRGMAWLGAAAIATVSPSFLLLRNLYLDAGAAHYVPMRLGVLVRYGEGPHMSSLAMLGFALAASIRGLQKGKRRALAASALFSALVVSHNFYGATALAILFPALVWALWITHRDHWIWWRAAAIASLAYGLTAFWLVPSYFRITLSNLKFVSEPGNVPSFGVAAAAVILLAAITAKLAWGREAHAWSVFVWVSAVLMSLNVLGNQFYGFRVAGEPGRLVPELDLVLVLLVLLVIGWLWRVRFFPSRRWLAVLPRVCAVVVVLLSFWSGRRYVAHAWEIFGADRNYRERIEYRVAAWMAEHLPHSRGYVTGSTRFWYNAWHDLAHVGGGSEQGVQNPLVIGAQWELNLGDNPELGLLWLKSLGVDAIVVHDKNSSEVYHDTAFPRRFQAVLPVAWDSGSGDVIYRVPRRWPGLARVVEMERAAALKPPAHQLDVENLRAYTALVEEGPDAPAEQSREGPDLVRIRATTGPGQGILMLETYDPYWRAYSSGRPLTIRKDVMNFMLIETPPGKHDIQLIFELPLENLIGRMIAAVAAVVLLKLSVFG